MLIFKKYAVTIHKSHKEAKNALKILWTIHYITKCFFIKMFLKNIVCLQSKKARNKIQLVRNIINFCMSCNCIVFMKRSCFIPTIDNLVTYHQEPDMKYQCEVCRFESLLKSFKINSYKVILLVSDNIKVLNTDSFHKNC